MKTKDFIKMLHECDPTGEAELCVHNEDISHIEMMPAYWDGRLEKATKRDESYGRPMESTITTHGVKIKIFPVNLSEIYIDSITEDGEEYVVQTEGGCGNAFGWLQADWNARKMTWACMAREYLTTFESYKKCPESQKMKIDLCNDIIDRCCRVSVEGFLGSVKKSANARQYQATELLVHSIVKHLPFAFDCDRSGSNYVAVSSPNWKAFEWKVYKNGKIVMKEWDKEEVEIDPVTYDFQGVAERFIKYLMSL